jgi:hypothetical protein
MDPRRVLREDPAVALAASRRDARSIDAAFGVVLAADVVVPVAIGALGGDEKAAFRERLAMDAVVVLGEHVADLDPAVLDDLGVAVAFPAHVGKVQRIRRRRRVAAGADVVLAMAIDAPRGADVPGLARLGVNALAVRGDGVGMTRGALHARQLFGVRELGLCEIRVAIGAPQGAVDRIGEGLARHRDRTAVRTG